ncbi:hypothetical protein Tco_0524665 [Tanacetum coccineum]
MNGTIYQEQSTPSCTMGTYKRSVDYDEVLWQPVAKLEAGNQTLLAFALSMAYCLSDGCQKCIFVWQHHRRAFLDSDYAGDNHDRRSTSGGLSNNYVKKTGLLAMQETNNCGYLLYRSRICRSCKLLCSGSLDAKSTT